MTEGEGCTLSFVTYRLQGSFRHILAGAGVLSFLQILASVCGFLRDRAFATIFPPGHDPLGVASIYIAAFRPSDFLFQSFIVAILSVILVPLLSKSFANKNQEDANRITQSLLMLLSGIFGIIAIIWMIMLPWIAPLLTKFTGPAFDLYVAFGRITLLTNFLLVFGNTFGNYLIAKRSFWYYGIPPILWALSTMGGILWLTPIIGVYGPIVGTLIGTLIFTVIRIVGAYKQGFTFSRSSPLLHPALRSVGWLILPRILALGSVQFQFLWFDRLGSGFGSAAIAINQFAFNFESLIPGFIGVAIAQSCFSLLGEAAAKGDYVTFSRHRNHAIILATIFSIIGAIVLGFSTTIAAFLIGLKDGILPVFSLQVITYCFAAPFDSVNHVLLRTFYAQQNTKIPALSSIISSITGAVTASYFASSVGPQAIAIGYGAACFVQLLILCIATMIYGTKDPSHTTITEPLMNS